ncbi:MAG: BON domain-containing protein [Gammaproteobacteria bacterium]|nr:BON domain-containing protein [Gammaproteobacteria bacterium]
MHSSTPLSDRTKPNTFATHVSIVLTTCLRASCLLTSCLLTIGLLTGCATLTGSDPGARSPGTIVDDEFIERIAGKELNAADDRLKAANIDVVSFNGIVLLTGQIENQQLKAQAGSVVEQIRKVRKVHNELQIGGVTNLLARGNDAWISTLVKTSLISSANVNADRVKVVTEDHVVYLMGKVPREQAEFAVEVTRKVVGVQKIVKVFEYVD